ncbi:terminase large subunit [Paracoccus laeviglucosivorans]|uniref:Phage terminase-like protein, large subunit, contains N-terminal HTH domain n=1 Tax=Paracoccus laeviglucosivorans TaxID=1197861 RepID=A0A521E588_9RHOB|nr:terminase large subunit [Paracoccus laeviglucosivorans]SMO79114.1 Phage terminase-like protein, large subunit, contains N-terminal HTH domain [Paracoccus laeviglucosivorans]
MPLDGVSFSCPDWADKLRQGRTPIPDLPLDDVLADAAVDLFNLLRVPDIPGQPTMAEAGGDWIRDIVRAAFGSVDAKTGKRFVGEILNLIPKKNSKTTNAAALGLVAMMMNRRPNIDGVIIGPTQEVAEKCFAQAAGMIAADPYLTKRFKVIEHKKTILDLHKDEDTGVRMNAKLKIKSFDPKVVTGSIPAFAIIDELHLMAEMNHAARVIGQIRGGMITNDESLLIIITTQSEIPPAGVFKAELQYARGVRDGTITAGVRMLPILYEFPVEMQSSEDKAWRDPKVWPMVLPNLGRSVTLDRLVADYQGAVSKGIEEEIRWASQHLNIEIGMGLHANRWPGANYWIACGDRKFTFDDLIDQSEVCVAGVDGGGLDDLFALAAIGRHRITKKWLHWAHCWAFDDVLKQRQDIAPRLRDFEKDGDLTICENVNDDVTGACDRIDQLEAAGLLPIDSPAIALDSHGIAELLDELEARGYADDRLISIGQGWKLQQAVLTLPRRLKDRKFIHGSTGLMTWNVGNAKTELKGSNYIVTKQVAGSAKIDALMATFNAAMLMFGNPEGVGPSVYETRGIRRV